MTAKQYLLDIGFDEAHLPELFNDDDKSYYKIAELIESYHKAKVENLGLFSVSNRFSDKKFIDNVCLSYRHDFGLLSKDKQKKVRFECKEWMRAIKNNEPY